MAMKGMETGIKVLLAVISVLVVVLIILSIFSGGAQDIGERVEQWIGGVPETPQACSAYTGDWSKCTLFAGCQRCGDVCISSTERCEQ